MNNKFPCLLLTLFLNGVLSNTCEKHDSCHKCIQDPSLCAWCATIEDIGSPCKPLSFNTIWCTGGSLQNPPNITDPIENRPFSSSPVTQLKPQSYNIKIRAGQENQFNFSYKGVQGYPVDLYFLFDASTSMNGTIKETADQSQQIYESIKNMTDNVYLGMGTFIDKNALPFTLNVTNNLAYSFKHRLDMNNNSETFQSAVANIPIGKNRDAPEGGLDALAQAIVCKEEIKWRTDSRKIIILLTDSPFHSAGDGRSGGIIKPYDGGCYMKDGNYINELKMDYPSVSVINRLARDKRVIVIFLVSLEHLPAYEDLASCIRESRAVAFDQTNNNITNILKNIYEEITKTIKLNWNVRSGLKKNFDITFDPDCTKEKTDSDEQIKKLCSIRIDEEYEFKGKIKLKEYDRNNNSTVIDITMQGINEKLELHVDVIRSCDCEKNFETNSPYCNNEILQCGQCKCSDRKYGNRCACTRDQSNTDDESTCIEPGKSITCSGRGSCVCGVCVECHRDFTGKYCECMNNCERGLNGTACSGTANGKCQCNGKCECEVGRTGNACQCDKEASKPCMFDGKVCNNRGNCTCGAMSSICECQSKASWDKREEQNNTCVVQPCVNFSECHKRQCNYLDECAVCILNQHENCACSKFVKHKIIQELPDEQVLKEAEWSVCPKVRVDVGCYSTYAYKYDIKDYGILLKLQRSSDCNKIYYTTAAAILGSILLIGILTMVAWKLINDYRDRKEYERFLKDHENDGAAKCENPLYETPSTMINNPAFRKRSINRY